MFEMAPAFMRRFRIGEYEIRVHCDVENSEPIQGWLYRRGALVDTILTVDKNKNSKLGGWLLKTAE